MAQTTLSGIPVLWEEAMEKSRRRLVIWLPGLIASEERIHDDLKDLASAYPSGR